ncbi:MAG TPA: hypothetical protein VMW18_09780, partial [Candidatus Binatia bacterium]|nr:hypothetical protein [Candidatus Binatia bacterium]
MANDVSNQQPTTINADMSSTGAHEPAIGAVQVAEATNNGQPATPPAVPNTTINVQIPQGATVVRVPVAQGDTVILPPPFDTAHHFDAKEGNGNLAIKVGDVTVILQGYVDAANDPQHPVVIDGADGKPVDIATVLASTDPNLDIQTAAGPGAVGAQGATTTGILSEFAGAPGLGGFNAVGALDQTALNYKLIDNSIRQEIGPLTPAGSPG